MQRYLIGGFLLVLFVSGGPANAQWVTQVIELDAGWNAVHLKVDPYPARCEDQFRYLPIESVWSHDERLSSAQFITDPDQLVTNLPDWRHYFPPQSEEAAATNLFRLQEGQCYLIKATRATTWRVTGTPRLVEERWRPEAYNLVGFHVSEDSPPTFATWFENSSAHQPLDIWTLGAGGEWQQVTETSTATVESGRAYWVFAHQATEYQGPVQIESDLGRNIDFDRILADIDLDISHTSSAARTVTVSLEESEPAPVERPDSPLPERGGEVPLRFKDTGLDQSPSPSFLYESLPASIVFSGTERYAKSLELEVRRVELTPAPAEAVHGSLLVIRDGAGYERRVAVTTLSAGGSAPSFKALGIDEPSVNAGLWSGFVVLNEVSDPAAGHPLRKTPAEFEFRMMLHVDADEVVRLLDEVTLLWRDGTSTPDPNTGNPVIDVPGRTILMTANPPQSLLNDILAGDVKGSSLRDGRDFAHRITCANFSLRDATGTPETPIVHASGPFGVAGTILDITLTLEDSDPVNPFHHQYHPQHAYPDGTPHPDFNYTIRRAITLTFADGIPDGILLPGAGDRHVEGFYTETVSGLRKDPITVSGIFRLQKAATVPVLNDGL